MLALFALLCGAIGAIGLVGAIGGGTANGHGTAAGVFGAIAGCAAALLALLGWGVHRSVEIDLAAQEFDAAVPGTALTCGCGGHHDPAELHVTDAPPQCDHDGTGLACSHDCQTCVLAAQHPSRTRSEPAAG